MKRFFISALCVPLLVNCAPSERPEYTLADDILLILQAGDSNTYAVLNADSTADKLESYSETLNRKATFFPDNTSGEILVESFDQSGNLIYPFVSRMFQQDDDGNLMLLGVTRGGQDYWIVDDNLKAGTQLLPANLGDLDQTSSISTPLKRCENQICETQGQLDITITPEGIENVETNYADFETYKFSIEWDLNLFDSENANNSINQLLRKEGSKQWIHPAIGVVKFVYQVQTDSQSATLIGNLTQTNISIPDRYKK